MPLSSEQISAIERERRTPQGHGQPDWWGWWAALNLDELNELRSGVLPIRARVEMDLPGLIAAIQNGLKKAYGMRINNNKLRRLYNPVDADRAIRQREERVERTEKMLKRLEDLNAELEAKTS